MILQNFFLIFFLCWKRSFKRRGRTEKFDNFGLISFVVVVVVVIGGGGERKKWQAGNRGGGRPGYDPYAFFLKGGGRVWRRKSKMCVCISAAIVNVILEWMNLVFWFWKFFSFSFVVVVKTSSNQILFFRETENYCLFFRETEIPIIWCEE